MKIEMDLIVAGFGMRWLMDAALQFERAMRQKADRAEACLAVVREARRAG